MPLKIIVLAKQVPDTHNVTADAMKADGTVNRAALPAVFNPEDLNALELALDVKERFGAHITVITMGPPRAADILREALYRGADSALLVTDRSFAGADTLATSYVLAKAIDKIADYDFVMAGRQAIDGDTAQIGPQVAEKIGVNQLTYVHSILDINETKVTLSRNMGRSDENIQTQLPILITVPASANQARTFGARRMLKYKKAQIIHEIEKTIKSDVKVGRVQVEDESNSVKARIEKLKKKDLFIETWSAADLEADTDSIGLAGSPTKVKKVQSIVLQGAETKKIEATKAGIKALFHELIEDHTFG